MSRLLPAAFVAAFLAFAVAACGGSSERGPVTLNWWSAVEPSGSRQVAAQRCSEQSNGRYRIAFQGLGNNPDQQRPQLVRRLAAGDKSIDIVGLDVVWVAEFAGAGWIRAFPEDARRRIEEGRLQGPLTTATYEDKLYGVPSDSNTQLLWYRRSKVQGRPPATWSDLIQEASRMNTRIEIAGAAAENTTVWFNALVASAGGEVLRGPTTPVFGRPVEQALQIMGELANSKAADPSISQQREDQNRLAFEQDQGDFMVNWPFVYPSAQENAPEIGRDMAWAPYPRVDANRPARAPIGGFNQAVSTTSEHPEEAFAAAECLGDAENQREYAKGGLAPTLSEVYDDQAFEEQYPFGDLIRSQLEDGGPRPVSPAYADISLAIYTTLSPPQDANQRGTLDALRSNLEKAVDSRALL